MLKKTNRHIVFKTENTSLEQDDSFRGYVLTIGNQQFKLDRYGFSFLKKSIKAIDLVSLLSSKTADVEILKLLNDNNFVVVDIHLAIELKELLAGSLAMLELNQCIHKGICRKAIHA